MRLCCLKDNQLRKLMLNPVLSIQDGVVMLVTGHGTTKNMQTCKRDTKSRSHPSDWYEFFHVNIPLNLL